MAITLDQLVKTYKSHGDTWRAYNRMKTLAADDPAGTLPRLLWRAHREKRLNLGNFSDCWYDLGSTPDAFTGDDFVNLLDAIASSHVPKAGTYVSVPWSDSETPGWPYNFHNIFDDRVDDDAFMTSVARRWSELPEPYNRALGYRLALHGRIPVEELPEDLITEYARFYIERDEYGSELWLNAPWPEGAWIAKQLELFEVGVARVKSFQTIERLLDHATPAQIVRALSFLTSTTNERLPMIDFFEQNAARYVDALEAALLDLDLSAPSSYNYDAPDPYFYLSLSYLAACRGAELEVSGEALPALQAFVSSYKPGWSGGYFEEYHRRIHGYLRVIGEQQLEAMLLADSERFPVLLAASAPTDRVCDAFVAYVNGASTDGVGYDFEDHVKMCFDDLGDAAITAASEALAGKQGAHSNLIIEYLGKHNNNEGSVKGLIAALQAKGKKRRELAHRALLGAETTIVLELLEPLVSARAKSKRLAAAKLLVALPATGRGYELARTQLAKEKTEEVRLLLEGVEEPDALEERATGTDLELEEATEQLTESEGKNWQRFGALGDALPRAFMGAWKESAGSGTITWWLSDSYDTLADTWIAMLRELGASNEAGLLAAVSLLGAMSDYNHSEYLGVLDGIYGPERVGEQLAHLLSKGRLIRPGDFEPCGYSKPEKECRKLLLERYPRAAVSLVGDMLRGSLKKERESALAFMVDHGAWFELGDFEDLLVAKKKDLREVGARLFAAFGDEASVSLLQAVAAKEKAREVRRSLAYALMHIDERGFDAPDELTSAAQVSVLDRGLGGLARIELPERIDVLALSTPNWSLTGAEMSDEAFRWLLAAITRESMTHRSELLEVVRGQLDEASAHTLCEELVQAMAPSDVGWVLFMQPLFASDARIGDTGKRLEEYAKSQTYGWGDHGVEVMVRRETPQAIRILDDWSRRTRRDGLKRRCEEALQRMASARGISVDDLTELAITNFGFDADARRRFDYGGRVIRVELGLGDELVFFDEAADKQLKSMPRAKATDQQALVTKARAELTTLKKELKRWRRVQSRRFQNAMVSGRRWEIPTWRERYALNPVMRSFSRGMVWGIFDAETDELLEPVHVDVSGDVVDIEDETIALDVSGHKLGVVHPALLSSAERQGWIDCFVDYELIESFPQLTRQLHHREDWPETYTALCSKLPGVQSLTFMGRAERSGWDKGPREDAGLINYTTRWMGKLHITLEHDGYSPEAYSDETIYITGIGVERDGTEIPLGELPAHVFSELIYELTRLTGEG